MEIPKSYSENVQYFLDHNKEKDNSKSLAKIKDVFSKKENDVLDFIKKRLQDPDELFKQSCDFFLSSITLTNWFDELENKNAIGLYVKISNNSNKISAYNISKISIDNITATFMPTVDSISIKATQTTTGNISLPLYINKYHWKVGKKYINMLTGLVIFSNPLHFVRTYRYTYFLILVKMARELIFTDTTLNERYVRCFISVLRTCCQLCFEAKFNVDKYINSYIISTQDKIDNTYVFINIIAQVLSTGFKITDEKIQIVTQKYLKSISTTDTDDQHQIAVSFFKMYKTLNMFYQENTSFSQVIKLIDDSYGVLPEKQTERLILLIKDRDRYKATSI